MIQPLRAKIFMSPVQHAQCTISIFAYHQIDSTIIVWKKEKMLGCVNKLIKVSCYEE